MKLIIEALGENLVEYIGAFITIAALVGAVSLLVEFGTAFIGYFI